MSILSGSASEQKFQARVLGLMYEDLLVPCIEAHGYEVLVGKKDPVTGNANRPTVTVAGKSYEFDYVLSKEGRNWIAEAKCWPQFDPKHATADQAWIGQMSMKKDNAKLHAFLTFDVHTSPCRAGGHDLPIYAKMLIWWQVTPDERSAWRQNGIDTLSICDLLTSGRELPSFVSKAGCYRQWCNDLFAGLLGA